MALVFARMPRFKGRVLVKRADGSVWCGNDDAEAGELVELFVRRRRRKAAGARQPEAVPAEKSCAAPAEAGAEGGGAAAEGGESWLARAEAACESLKRAPRELQELLTLTQGGFWVKESPDENGADLLGVLPSVGADGLSVKVVRVQVKRAIQDTLKDPRQHERAGACLREAVAKLLGVEIFSDGTAADLENIHLPVVRAVWDIIAVAIIAGKDGWHVLDDKHLVEVKLKELFESGKVRFEDGGACVAMTHVPSRRTKQNAEEKGIQVFDGKDLKKYWGRVAVVCAAAGVWLWDGAAGRDTPQQPGEPERSGSADGGPSRRPRVPEKGR